MPKRKLPVPDPTWREYEFGFQLPPTDSMEDHNAFMQAIVDLAEEQGGYVGGGQTGPQRKGPRRRPRYEVQTYVRIGHRTDALQRRSLVSLPEAARRLALSLAAMRALIVRRKWSTVADHEESDIRKRLLLYRVDVERERRERKAK